MTNTQQDAPVNTTIEWRDVDTDAQFERVVSDPREAGSLIIAINMAENTELVAVTRSLPACGHLSRRAGTASGVIAWDECGAPSTGWGRIGRNDVPMCSAHVAATA